jgi:hypothetical protein
MQRRSTIYKPFLLEKIMSIENELCDLCKKNILEGDGWTDDDRYGDVHETCLEDAENGILPDPDNADALDMAVEGFGLTETPKSI